MQLNTIKQLCTRLSRRNSNRLRANITLPVGAVSIKFNSPLGSRSLKYLSLENSLNNNPALVFVFSVSNRASTGDYRLLVRNFDYTIQKHRPDLYEVSYQPVRPLTNPPRQSWVPLQKSSLNMPILLSAKLAILANALGYSEKAFGLRQKGFDAFTSDLSKFVQVP